MGDSRHDGDDSGRDPAEGAPPDDRRPGGHAPDRSGEEAADPGGSVDGDAGPDPGASSGSGSGEAPPEGDRDQWRFGIDEVDEDGIVRPGIEPGTPKPEHVLFVALGVLAMMLVVGRIWLLL